MLSPTILNPCHLGEVSDGSCTGDVVLVIVGVTWMVLEGKLCTATGVDDRDTTGAESDVSCERKDMSREGKEEDAEDSSMVESPLCCDGCCGVEANKGLAQYDDCRKVSSQGSWRSCSVSKLTQLNTTSSSSNKPSNDKDRLAFPGVSKDWN